MFTSIVVNGSRAQHKFGLFAKFIADSTSLAGYVEELQLHGRRGTELNMDVLLDLFLCLPRLRVLFLDVLILRGSTTLTQPTFALKKLILCKARPFKKNQCNILDVLNLFPGLHHLRLGFFDSDFLPSMDGSDMLTSPWLRVPELTLQPTRYPLAFLRAAILDCKCLRLPGFGSLIQVIGFRIKNLEIELVGIDVP